MAQATEKQIALIKKLEAEDVAKRNGKPSIGGQSLIEFTWHQVFDKMTDDYSYIKDLPTFEEMTSYEASQLIGQMLENERNLRFYEFQKQKDNVQPFESGAKVVNKWNQIAGTVVRSTSKTTTIQIDENNSKRFATWNLELIK